MARLSRASRQVNPPLSSLQGQSGGSQPPVPPSKAGQAVLERRTGHSFGGAKAVRQKGRSTSVRGRNGSCALLPCFAINNPPSSHPRTTANVLLYPPATTVTNTGSNPLIPTTISTTCQAFLEYLNADEALSACTTPLISALALVAPSSATSSFTVTDAEITATLASVCGQTSCSDSMVRTALTAFSGNCTAELRASNAVVLGMYDVLYVLRPFSNAICSRDAVGGYCLHDITSGSVPVAPSNASTLSTTVVGNETVVELSSNSTVFAATGFNIQTYASAALDPRALFITLSSPLLRLMRRQATNETVIVTNTTSTPLATSTGLTGLLPNSTTWRAASLPFLFLSPEMPSNLLCTSCTKSVLAAYVAWGSRIPYALGLSNSPLLGGQSALWTAVGTTCGTGFQSSITAEAGTAVVSAAGVGAGARVGVVGVGMMVAVVLLA